MGPRFESSTRHHFINEREEITVQLVSNVEFANGHSYTILRDPKISKVGCLLLDNNNPNARYPATSVPAAWRKLMFMAGMNWETNNTSRWKG